MKEELIKAGRGVLGIIVVSLYYYIFHVLLGINSLMSWIVSMPCLVATMLFLLKIYKRCRGKEY